MTTRGEHYRYDWLTIGLYAAIVLFGWVNIFAVCFNEDQPALFDLTQQSGKQLLWMGISVVVALLVLLIRPRVFSNGAYIIYGLVMLLLLATLFIGTVTNGGQSWIDFGIFKLQPSEFAKFATALALSKYVSYNDVQLHDRSTQMAVVALVLVPFGLILLQHDTGSALVMLAFLMPLFREGVGLKLILMGIVAIVLFVVSLLVNKFIVMGAIVLVALFYLFVWLSHRSLKVYRQTALMVALCCLFTLSVDFAFNHVLQSHQRDRIYVLLGQVEDPQGVGYNVEQAKIAIGSGQLVGKGFLRGTITKADFVPEQETDFIFCTVGEEWGFLGSMSLIALYVFLLLHLVDMAERQRSRFSRFYGYSVTAILFFHFTINVGMVLGLVPVIGIPLPFFSYGGSSLFAFTMMLFLFIRLDAERNALF